MEMGSSPPFTDLEIVRDQGRKEVERNGKFWQSHDKRKLGKMTLKTLFHWIARATKFI